MKKNIKISIVIPVYNEQDNVSKISIKLVEILEKITNGYEIIFVDDCSLDDTLLNLVSINKKNNKIKYLEMSRRFGYQNSIFAGLEHSSGDAVITMDADFEHPPAYIFEMYDKWKEGYEVVNMVRDSYNQKTFIFNFFGKLFYKIMNFLSDIKLIENSADFRLIDRKVVDIITSFSERNIFLRGVLPWIGFNHASITYKQDNRLAGRTKFNFAKSYSLAIDGLTSFTTRPLYISIYIGFFFSIIGLFYFIWILYSYIKNSYFLVQGWSTIVSLQLIIGGLILIFFGIIGVYLAKTFDEVKGRPIYLIKKSSDF